MRRYPVQALASGELSPPRRGWLLRDLTWERARPPGKSCPCARLFAPATGVRRPSSPEPPPLPSSGAGPSPPPQGESLPFRGRGIPTPRKLPTSHLVLALVLSALKTRQENRPNEKTTPSPRRCPEDLKARSLLRLRPEGLRRLRRAVHIMARLPKDTAAIKVVPDPAEESGTRSPGRLPAPSRSGPGLRLKGPRHAPALSALALPGGKMTAPRLRDGPKERRGKPPLYLPASAGMGWAVRGKRSTTPSPRESLPRPTSRGGAEDPRLAPVPFAQSYPFVCSLIAPPRPSRARPCSECGSCPCPRRSIWGWDPKEAQHLGEEASRMPPPLKEQVPHFCEKSEVSRT